MSSGQRRKIFNLLERLTSGDLNDVQSYVTRSRAQASRRLHQAPSSGFDPWLSGFGNPDSTTNPAADYGTRHDVLGGLMVRPDLPSDLLVDPGSVAFFAPGYTGLTAEDSPYIVVDSPGVTSTGVLTFTPNGSGTPRIDIIECRPVDTLITSQVRDIFNIVTRIFNPTLVEKVREARLEFRIRLGTPDAGFPALDADWCPLAFCVVQTGASGFNQSDFYDVRPLVTERSNASSTGASTNGTSRFLGGEIRTRQIQVSSATGALEGFWKGSWLGYETGGTLRRNTASSIADFGSTASGGGDEDALNYSGTENRVVAGANAVVTTNGAMNCLVAIWPRGLGRCVRYSQGVALPSITNAQVPTTGRLPRGSNGILVLARPSNVTTKGSCLVQNLPAIFGASTLGSYFGVVLSWLEGSGGGVDPWHCNGKTHLRPQIPVLGTVSWTPTPALPAGNVTWAPASAPAPTGGFFSVETTPLTYPNTAKRILMRTDFSYSYNATPTQGPKLNQLEVSPVNYPAGVYSAGQWMALHSNVPTAALLRLRVDEWIDVPGKETATSGGGPGIDLSRLAASGETAVADFDGGTMESCLVGWEDE